MSSSSSWNTEFSSNGGDEWSNISLDLGLEDVDASQFHKSSDSVLFQSTMKDEEFFPTSFDQDLDRTQFAFHTETDEPPLTTTSLTETPLAQSAKPCPCCKVEIDLTLTDFHSHVSQCFLSTSSFNEAAAAHKHTQPSNKRIAESIQKIRHSVGQLDLHQRIRLMESLSRLANAATVCQSPNSTEERDQSNISSMSMESDHYVLSLLYANPTDTQTVLTKEQLLLKVPNTVALKSDKSFPESSTPTLCPSSPTYMTRHMYSPITYSPMSTRVSKRKRDIVQALSYEPSLSPNHKMARMDVAI
jgi:hypothetical protein